MLINILANYAGKSPASKTTTLDRVEDEMMHYWVKGFAEEHRVVDKELMGQMAPKYSISEVFRRIGAIFIFIFFLMIFCFFIKNLLKIITIT